MKFQVRLNKYQVFGSFRTTFLDLWSYFYIFNYGTNHFVVVSGDDAAYPILGYSIESAFNTSKIPQNFQKWFEGYKQQIYNIRKNALVATFEIQV